MVQDQDARSEHDILRLIGRKHTLPIIKLLDANGAMRYSELEEALGATSTSTLAKNLDDLVEAELLDRHRYDQVPPRVEYTLTRRGRELETHLTPLHEWTTDEA